MCLFSNNSTVFSCWCFYFHITIRVSLWPIFHLDTYKINPCKITINASVGNIYWYIFNLDQLFFVFLYVITIWASKLKHWIIPVVVSNKNGNKSINFPANLIKNNSCQKYFLGKFSINLWVTLSGGEYVKYRNFAAPQRS